MLTSLVLFPAVATAQVANPVFGTPVAYEMPGILPSRPVIADLNEDGHLDLVAAAGEAAILFGDGQGGFDDDDSFTVVQRLYDPAPGSVCRGDFNGDGHVDLAFTLRGQLNGLFQPNRKVEVFLGDGNGDFAHSATLLTGVFPIDCAAGDFDEDGNDDLVVISNLGGLDVFPGLGTGQFAAAVPVQGASGNGVSLDTFDLDGDGHLDLFAGHAGTFSYRRVYWGDGSGQYSRTSALSLSPGNLMTPVDFDGDGKLDLVGTAPTKFPNWVGGLRTYRNNGDRTFSVQGPFGAPAAWLPVAGDFNLDGIVDLAGLTTGIGFFQGVGDGSFLVGGSSPTGANTAGSLVAGDWDEDGHTDLAVTDSNAAQTPYLNSILNLTTPADWTFLGGRLEGSTGLPFASGAWDTTSGLAAVVDLSDALPGAPSVLILGLSRVDQPLLGGTLIPAAQALLLLPAIGSNGTATWSVPFPAGVPSGLEVFAQAWILDPRGVQGFAAANGLRGVTP